MKMSALDVWVWEELKMTKNPMFTIGELCRRLPNADIWHGGDSHDINYNAVRRSVNKFENFGLLHVYRVVNGGTVFMSKERAL